MPKKNVIKKSAMVPTALIAGGAGFIGSHLCEALLSRGARVIVLDNFNTGKEIHINHLLQNPNFALYNVDINTGLPPEIESVDYIFHLAGLEEYLYSKESVNLNSLLTNALGTKNLLDLAQRSQAKFLLVSSIDVYEGRMSQLELEEYFGSTKIDENKYMLTEAKRYAEALVWEYYKKNDTDLRIVRLPEIFGPRMDLSASGSLGMFLKDLIEHRDITVYGEGSNKEYYLYITDAISGILKTLFGDKSKGNIYSLVWNVPTTVLQLAYVVKSVADREVNIVFKNNTSKDNYRPNPKIPDSFNLRQLGWEPRMDIKDGIVKSLEYFGYKPNAHSFKPAELIEKKTSITQELPKEETGEIFTLQDVKEPEKEIAVPVLHEISEPAPPAGPSEPVQSIQSAPVTAENPYGNLQSFHTGQPEIAVKQKQKIKLLNFGKLFSVKVLSIFGVLFSAMLIFFALPGVQTYFYTRASMNSMSALATSAGQLDSAGVRSNARSSYQNLVKAKNSFANLKWFFLVSGKQSQFESMDKLYSSLAYFSKSGYQMAETIEPFENLWEVVRPDTAEELDPASFESVKSNVDQAKNTFQLALADFKQVNIQDLPVQVREKAVEYQKVLDITSKGLDMAAPVLSSFPNILGADESKKYMILFQNSNEIRPTGGFIGSYGLLTFEKGKIKDLLIDDIYNPDGQIELRNINVAPPEQIKEFLNEERLYIRNANWDPDFPVSANTISDLYFKVTGESLDGVIAVDLYFVQNILKATGPIFLTAYNEEINAENLYERAEFHSEFNYENGSDSKRSFLTVLGSKLLEKIFSLSREQLPQLFTEMGYALNDRHLLITLANDPLNALLEEQHWNGGVVDTTSDYLYVVNANVGGTKANYYVKNKMNYHVKSLTRDGLLRGVLVLEYVHTGTDDAWPGGPYENYVRVLTQEGSKLTGATLKVNDGEEKDVLNEIRVSTLSKYNVFGTSFTLNPTEKITLTIEYDLPAAFTLTKEQKEYALYWQKQSGTHHDEYEFSFDVPFGFEISTTTEGLVREDGTLKSIGSLNEDKKFYAKLQ
ncbi:DUF4012 domain-containing protein [candidate division WWE3 bacterium]|jgi:nucleoside-diphosphate-sugar epimerase|uniref:DUF4012 domain-containing protein n=1 Tax=candidate division WWE3 bacterium TaxID=2053526 RepID=A0A3A4ZCG9_UNCKA|nr:MAG: DUF4012 domain-containing protein [candidate division WWE3 bacterium]